MNFKFKERFRRIVYTCRHKVAYLRVEKRLFGKNTLRGYFHDIDKILLYLALWIEPDQVQKIHRKHSKHHVQNQLFKKREDLIDTIIDWECARLTKPDKPLNAYETLMRFYPEYQETYLPIIRLLLPAEIPETKEQFAYGIGKEKSQAMRFEATKVQPYRLPQTRWMQRNQKQNFREE